MTLNFKTRPVPKCKNCGRQMGQHKADTMNCPWGLSRTFPNFRLEQFYEPKIPRAKK